MEHLIRFFLKGEATEDDINNYINKIEDKAEFGADEYLVIKKLHVLPRNFHAVSDARQLGLLGGLLYDRCERAFCMADSTKVVKYVLDQKYCLDKTRKQVSSTLSSDKVKKIKGLIWKRINAFCRRSQNMTKKKQTTYWMTHCKITETAHTKKMDSTGNEKAKDSLSKMDAQSYYTVTHNR